MIFGIRGGGKTVKLRRLLLSCSRYLVVNTLNRPGFNCGVTFHTVPDLKKFWLKVYRTNFRLIFSPLPMTELEASAEDSQSLYTSRICNEISQICELVYACGDMTFAIEEMNVLFDELRVPHELNRILYSGRESGIEFIGVAQQPVGFGAAMRSQTKEAFIFHTHEDSHLAIFRKLVGKENAEKIRKLANYEYLHWSMQNGEESCEIQKDEPLPYM